MILKAHRNGRTAIIAWSLLAALALSACSGGEPPKYLLPGSLVLAFGDSITYGTGAPLDADYPTHLFKLTGLGIVNAGIPGETSAQARKRLDGLLELHKPDLVIVELGGNDFLERRREELIRQDLKAIVERCKASGAETMLVAVPRLSMLRAATGTLKDADLYAEIAEETGAILVDGLVADILSSQALRSDPIHPNSAGYRLLAQGIVARMRDAELLPPLEEE
jgi:acyl-CoA hydrolase